MLYFTLPSLYKYPNLSKKIFEMNKKVFKENIKIISQTEYIPYCYAQGLMLKNTEDLLSYGKMQNISNSSSFNIVKRIDASNIYFNPDNFDDEQFNLILNFYQNGSNQIDISNFQLLEYIKMNYPNYDINLSSNADLIANFTPEIINAINSFQKFNLITLPYYLSINENFLSQLENPSCIELTINSRCFNCPIESQRECQKKENDLIYWFKSSNDCGKNISSYSKKGLISLDMAEEYSRKFGINHFRIAEFSNSKREYLNFMYFFVKYFIKEDKQEEVLYYLELELTDND